jgi:predicted dehydrogenase
MSKLRVGVIGVGHLGQHHARLYAALPNAVLVGVVDTRREQAKSVAERCGAAVFDGLDALLKEVQAVSVAVPTSDHYAVTKACLAAGVHVLVEKPIAVEPREAHDLVRLAREARLVLQVGHVERFNPGIVALRSRVSRPAYIECQRLSRFGLRGTDVNVVLDLMIHDLDIVLSFQPGPVEEIRAVGAPVLTPLYDMAQARIQFAGGCVASLTASRVSEAPTRTIRVVQRDAAMTMDYHTRQGMILRPGKTAAGEPAIESEPLHGGEGEPLKLELEAFLHSVSTGVPPVVSGEDGAAALDLAHRIQDSIRTFLQRQK